MLPELDGCSCNEYHLMESTSSLAMAYHEKPDDTWMQILNTCTLFAGEPSCAHPGWFRWPLRNSRPMSTDMVYRQHFAHACTSMSSWDGSTVLPDASGMFTMYRCLQVESLVNGHPDASGSNGVLHDGGLSHGTWHGDGIGVYAYSYFPERWCSAGDGWCILELRSLPHWTRVAGGTRGRYVMKSEQKDDARGTPCHLIEVVALWHMYRTTPNFCKV